MAVVFSMSICSFFLKFGNSYQVFSEFMLAIVLFPCIIILSQRERSVFMASSLRARDPYFDNIKGILSYSVIALHCLLAYSNVNPSCKYLAELIHIFVMPLFMYISGYFSKNLERCAAAAYEALLLPAIPFELAYFLLHWITKADNFYPFMTPIFAYWYLFALFAYRILMPYMVKLRGMLPLAFLIALGIGFNNQIGEYMNLSRFFCYLPCFLLGYYTSKETMAKIRNMNRILCAGWAIAAAVVLYLVLFHTGIEVDYSMSAGYTNYTGLIGRTLFYLMAIPACLFILRFSPSGSCILERYGQRSLQIYLLNFYGVAVVELLNPLPEDSVLNAAAMLIAPAILTVLFGCPITDFCYNLLMRITKKLLLKPERTSA